MEFASPITPKDNTFSEEMQMDMISKKLANDRLYAYHGGRFWFWDEGRSIWKESHLLAKKYNLNHEYDKLLTPEDFLSDPSQFQALEDYEVDYILKSALQNAQPCKNAPIDPVEETAVVPAQAASPAATAEDKPAAPSFDFGADDQTNALLLQDAQTFITGNMARIMAAKHAHDLTANHYKGSWGKWCAAVGISRDTGDNMVRVAEQFGNIQLEGKSIFDVQPMKLLYAAAKPSTPEEVKQAVFTGDITTYKEYQEVMAQLKAEKERADAAEAERDKLLGAQNRAAWAESHIQDVEAQRDAALADVQGLTEQNAKLKERADSAEAREEEAWKLQSKSEAKAKDAETELEAVTADLNGLYDRAAQAEARNTALLDERAEYVQRIKELESRPIEVMHDPEETDRLAHQYAYGIAADTTEELRTKNNQQSQTIAALQKELEAARSTNGYDPQSDLETVCACIGSMEQMWGTALPAYERLSGKDLRTATDTLQDVIGRLYGDMARTAEDGED